jgi:hypothetical protein
MVSPTESFGTAARTLRGEKGGCCSFLGDLVEILIWDDANCDSLSFRSNNKTRSRTEPPGVEDDSIINTCSTVGVDLINLEILLNNY